MGLFCCFSPEPSSQKPAPKQTTSFADKPKSFGNGQAVGAVDAKALNAGTANPADHKLRSTPSASLYVADHAFANDGQLTGNNAVEGRPSPSRPSGRPSTPRRKTSIAGRRRQSLDEEVSLPLTAAQMASSKLLDAPSAHIDDTLADASDMQTEQTQPSASNVVNRRESGAGGSASLDPQAAGDSRVSASRRPSDQRMRAISGTGARGGQPFVFNPKVLASIERTSDASGAQGVLPSPLIGTNSFVGASPGAGPKGHNRSGSSFVHQSQEHGSQGHHAVHAVASREPSTAHRQHAGVHVGRSGSITAGHSHHHPAHHHHNHHRPNNHHHSPRHPHAEAGAGGAQHGQHGSDVQFNALLALGLLNSAARQRTRDVEGGRPSSHGPGAQRIGSLSQHPSQRHDAAGEPGSGTGVGRRASRARRASAAEYMPGYDQGCKLDANEVFGSIRARRDSAAGHRAPAAELAGAGAGSLTRRQRRMSVGDYVAAAGGGMREAHESSAAAAMGPYVQPASPGPGGRAPRARRMSIGETVVMQAYAAQAAAYAAAAGAGPHPSHAPAAGGRMRRMSVGETVSHNRIAVLAI